jgi:polyhydroxyalkanoate synthase
MLDQPKHNAPAHENLMAFATGLVVDTAAASNFAATNPDVISATVAGKGQNLVGRAKKLAEDLGHLSGAPQPAGARPFEVGRNLATAPGTSVMQT